MGLFHALDCYYRTISAIHNSLCSVLGGLYIAGQFWETQSKGHVFKVQFLGIIVKVGGKLHQNIIPLLKYC